MGFTGAYQRGEAWRSSIDVSWVSDSPGITLSAGQVGDSPGITLSTGRVSDSPGITLSAGRVGDSRVSDSLGITPNFRR